MSVHEVCKGLVVSVLSSAGGKRSTPHLPLTAGRDKPCNRSHRHLQLQLHNRLQPCQHIQQQTFTRHLPETHLNCAMSAPRPPLKPHLSAVDVEASPSSHSSTSTPKYVADRQKLASPTSREVKPAPAVSRKYEIQQRYRQLSTIGFTSLVMGS